jgi:hypothetical protein
LWLAIYTIFRRVNIVSPFSTGFRRVLEQKTHSPQASLYRSHWTIETLLSQPEFKDLQWTSLRPNYFTATYLASTAG